MTAPFRIVGIVAALGLVAGPASAHGALAGVGYVYGGLLHPLVVPAEILAIFAVGLAFGVSGKESCRAGLAALAAGLAIGLSVGRFIPGDGIATAWLVAVALFAASMVVADLRLSPWLAAALALVGGIALGLDARPEPRTTMTVLAASAATMAGAMVLTIVVSALVLGRDRPWQAIAARVAGSWVTATAILYFAWRIKTLST